MFKYVCLTRCEKFIFLIKYFSRGISLKNYKTKKRDVKTDNIAIFSYYLITFIEKMEDYYISREIDI